MTKTLRQIISIKAALWVNAFLYYLKRLWLIGGRIPDSVYSCYRWKKILSAAAVAVRLIADFLGKPLYLYFFILLPLTQVADIHPGLKGHEFDFMVQAVFFLNCCIGSFGDSQIFTVTRDKVIGIKFLRMDARGFVQSFLAFKFIPFFTFYLLWLLIFTGMFGGTALEGFRLWLTLFSFRMMGETFHLAYFTKTGKVISRSMWYEWALIIPALIGAYLPAALGWQPPAAAILLHPACTAVFTLIGVGCLWYILRGYQGYGTTFHRSIDQNFLFSSLLKNSSGSAGAFQEVKIRDKDAAATHQDIAQYQNLKGYSYFNAIFFARHRRQLLRPVYYRILTAVVMFAASVVFWAVKPDAAVAISRNMASLLPSFLFVMYFMTIADKASRAMFYNCDKDMLRFAFYREPKAILKNFRLRFQRVSIYNAAIAGAVCLGAAAFCLLCKTTILTADFLLFSLSILLLSVFFTVHHLCLYYIFQPYSENLKVKNPFFSVINGIVYLLCFFFMQMNIGGLSFTMSVLAVTILYIFISLALVYRRAPKTFRVK